jgi:hypothetical protein
MLPVLSRVLVWLYIALPAAAADPTPLPPPKPVVNPVVAPLKIEAPATVPSGKLVRVTLLNLPADAAVVWDVFPEELADVEELPDGRLYFTGPAGEYRIKARAIVGKLVTTARATVTIGDGEDAKPKPKPKPGPAPAPDNLPASKLFLVVVEETGEAVAGRGEFFADKALSSKIRDRGDSWRVVDKDVVGPDGKPPADVVRFLDLAKGKPYPSLFLVDDKGKTRFAGPMPAKPAALADLLTTYGGK